MRRLSLRTLCSVSLAAAVTFTAAALPGLAQAQDHWDDHRGDDHRGGDRRGDDHHGGSWGPGGPGPARFRDHDVMIYGHGPVVVPEFRRRTFRDVVVLRPYGGFYAGYGRYYDDGEAYRWLGLTAITLTLLNSMSEQQERALEDAQIQATSAPVGAPIVWNTGNAGGSVTTLRDGHTTDGQYCREFQQTVTIGGETQQAYGTACQQPDGAWHVVADN
ncbi:MAG: RT0821/Lpp0805 family surface protein [Azospirillaceae bacterium]|nr:RT0821/Lpp0805 family surface protein [Azospirillaceae bacterium]